MIDRLETARGKGGEQREEQAGVLAMGQTGSPPCSSFSRAGWESPLHAPTQPQCTALPAPLLGRAGVYLHQTSLKIPFLAPRNTVQTTKDRVYALQSK